MSRYQRYFLGVIILAIAAGIVAWKIPITRGLDIDGGIRVVMQADPVRKADWPSKHEDRMVKLNSIRKTITKRVEGLQGVAEPVVLVQEPDKVIVELPGVKDPEAALDRIKSTASLEFYWLKDVQTSNNPTGKWDMRAAEGEEKAYVFTGPRGETIDSEKQPKELLEKVVDTKRNPPILTGKDLMAKSKANIDSSNKVIISIEFNKEGTEVFREFTRAHVDDILAVFFDGKLLTAPSINEAIPSGKAEISGFSSLQEARQTAEYLDAGALPVPLKVIAKDSVEPTLGQETVRQVVFAGLIGIVLVILFMLIYYKLPGLIASIALCLYALFVIAIFKAIHATMSLAGIAALIISIGMAVDANILIFERLKEELRSGKTLRAAIDAGFNRAFTAIFDSNMCTAITTAILMWYGTAAVKSFAFTLLVGVAISMFTAITVTRTILHLLVNWEWAQKPSLYGLTTGWMSGSGINLDIVGKRAYYFVLSAILIVPGLFFLATSGLKPGIEFKSGTAVQANFERPANLDAVRSIVDKYSPKSEVQLGQAKKVAFIKMDLRSEDKGFDEKMAGIQTDLNEEYGLSTKDVKDNPVFASTASVGPSISEELTRNAFWAVVLASLAIVVYLTFRFAIGGITAGLKYGTCAVIALVHDAAFILGLFAILGKFAGWEVDSLFVTAILTVIGFSVHDTIVVFDRIRENLRHRLRGESFEQLCNRSILQTLSRSINTSFTVVLTISMLIAFGGPLLRHFYIALLAGIIIGTYSSIFNATPLVIVWEKLAAKTNEPKRKESEGKVMVEKPMESVIDVKSESVTEVQAETLDANGAAKTAKAKKKPTVKKKRF